MSDMAQESVRYRINAYHETAENAALRGQQTPPPEPITIARRQLSLAVREHGEVIDLDSVAEDNRVAVVVDDKGEWVPAGDATPTGHIVTWSCTAHPRVSLDADDPILDVTPTGEGAFVAEVPEPLRTVGGSCRIRHGRGREVTVLAKTATGEGIGYLFATTLDKDTVHVEFFGGTASFLVTED